MTIPKRAKRGRPAREEKVEEKPREKAEKKVNPAEPPATPHQEA